MNTLELLARLVAFDTVSSRSNLALVNWVADHLDGFGVPVQLIANADGSKANLLARIGPEVDGGLLLSGHSDVVPVEGQAWSGDPFALALRDGRAHGRGAADMKGFIAACLAAVPGWRAAPLRRPLYLALTYDEEITCAGAQQLAAHVARALPRPALAVVGEPTGMRVGLAHRGVYCHRTVFHGRPAHSGDPSRGADAIRPATQLVARLAALEQGLREGGTTFNIGRIDGGTAVNIVPERCELLWEFRPADAAGERAVRQAVEGILAALPPGITAETVQLAGIPPLVSHGGEGSAAEGDPAEGVHLARRLGAQWPAQPLPFGTEAGFYQQAGIAAVVCGPGSIAQAHQPDEWIALSQLAAADRFMAAAGRWAAH